METKDEKETKTTNSDLGAVSGSILAKAEIINALVNTATKLEGYNSIKNNALNKLEDVIKSIDI